MLVKLWVHAVVHHKGPTVTACFLRDVDGERRTIYLDPHGSREAQGYREVMARQLAGVPVIRMPDAEQRPSVWSTVARLVAAYLLRCDRC